MVKIQLYHMHNEYYHLVFQVYFVTDIFVFKEHFECWTLTLRPYFYTLVLMPLMSKNTLSTIEEGICGIQIKTQTSNK